MQVKVSPIEVTLVLSLNEANVLYSLFAHNIIGDNHTGRSVTSKLYEKMDSLGIFNSEAEYFEGHIMSTAETSSDGGDF